MAIDSIYHSSRYNRDNMDTPHIFVCWKYGRKVAIMVQGEH